MQHSNAETKPSWYPFRAHMKLKPRMVPPQVSLEHGSISSFDGPNCGSQESDDKYGSYGSGGQLIYYSCGCNYSRSYTYLNYTYVNGFTTLGESGYYCLDGDKDLFATDYAGSLWDHFTRVSPLFYDLWTGGQGSIYEGVAGTDDDEGYFVATWWGGQHYHDYHGASYFQASNVFVCFVVYSAPWL